MRVLYRQICTCAGCRMNKKLNTARGIAECCMKIFEFILQPASADNLPIKHKLEVSNPFNIPTECTAVNSGYCKNVCRAVMSLQQFNHAAKPVTARR